MEKANPLDLINLDEFSYPSYQIQEFGGIPQNTSYEYVANTFLDGLVNHGSNHVGFMLCRYGIDDPVTNDTQKLPATEEVYQKYADEATARIHFVVGGDDWLIMYETHASYMFMWYDRDCSDCIVERYSIASCAEVGIGSFDSFVEQRIAKYKRNPVSYFCEGADAEIELMVKPANKIRGWIRS